MNRQKRLPTTRPELSAARPKEPLAEPAEGRSLAERDTVPSMPKKRNTLPSASNDGPDNIPSMKKNGAYSQLSGRKAADIPAMIADLLKGTVEERPGVFMSLKKSINTLDKARDALSILPPDSSSNIYLVKLREHCISFIRKAMK